MPRTKQTLRYQTKENLRRIEELRERTTEETPVPLPDTPTSIDTTVPTTTSVVFTRNASTLALTHILDNVIIRPSINNAFAKASIDDTVGLLSLDDKAIHGLVYSHTDSSGVTTTQKLLRGDVGLIKSFIHYVYHRVV
jgi:hypothetical protein